jgi:hypothetical protein
MEKQTYTITFKGASGEIASRYVKELRNALLDAAPDIEVEQVRADDRTLDFGNTLILILGTPAIVAVTKAIGDWLKLRSNAIIDIDKDGHVHAENITSKDALRLAEIFLPKK